MSKYLPHGTTASIGGESIGGLIGVTLPTRTKGSAETTDTGSGGDRTHIPAIRDGDSIELTMRHDPDDTGQQALDSNYDADANEEVIITLPSTATSASGSKTYTFDGHVTQAPGGDQDLVADDAAEVTSTIKVSGTVTIA